MAHSPAFRRFAKLLQQARRLQLRDSDRPSPQPAASRRQFLKATLTGTLAWSALGSVPALASKRPPRVAIIGGGLAGLSAAWHLSQAGLRPMLYEARDRVGGRMRSVTGLVSEGVVTDLGAELVNTDHDDIHALLQDFGLTLTERKAGHEGLSEVGYFFAGQRRNEAELADALRPLAGQIMADAELVDADWDTWAPLFDEQSLQAYLDQHASLLPADPDIRYLIESLVRVEYGVEPYACAALQLLYLLPVVDGQHVELLSESDEAWTINGGSEALIQALRNVLQDRIRLNSPLTALARYQNGYRLTFGCNESAYADYVVLALPLNALRKVDIRLILPRSLRRFINEVNLGRNEKIVAGMNTRTWRTPEGFALEAWNDHSVSLLWDSSLRELSERENGALTFFLGAREVAARSPGSAHQQGADLLQEYDALLPGLKAASNGKFLRTAWHKTAGIQGGYTSFRPGQYTGFASQWMHVESEDAAERQVPAFKKIVLAGEHTSDAYYGFMNGAAQSGRLAAKWILGELGVG